MLPPPRATATADTHGAGVQTRHEPLLVMLIACGVVLWLLFVLWHNDQLALLYSNDRSRICFLISIAFVIMLAHCLVRSISISRQANATMELEQALTRQRSLYSHSGQFTDGEGRTLPLSPALQLLQQGLASVHAGNNEQNENSDTRDWMYERIARTNQVGWFCADLMIKLGLLGTIIGFIFMLGSISAMEDVDINSMRTVLQQMGSGMATALLTTMAGLGCSMVLGIMYFILDHYALVLVNSNHHLFHQAENILQQQQPGAEAVS